MSAERLKHQHEHEKSLEIDRDLQIEREKNIEKKIETAEKAKTSHDIETIRDSIEESAQSVETTKVGKEEGEHSVAPTRLDRSVKKNAYKKELKKVRKQLNTPQRVLSKVIHNPTIDSISEVGSKTIARPSGLLGGGVVASLGTLLLYISSRYYGFEYNFFVFILLLGFGFVLGVCIELIFYPILSKNKPR